MRHAHMLGFALMAMVLAGESVADSTITYQGQLRQSGQPYTGTANLEFRLFSQLSGGSQVGATQTRGNWPVEDGLFQVELDFGIAAFTDHVRYLEVRVNGTALTPRQAVRPSPMALFALAGNEGQEGPPGPQGPEGASPFTLSGSNAIYMDGNVGIGVSDPSFALLEVGGNVNQAILGTATATTGGTSGVWGQSNSSSGRGVFGIAGSTTGNTSGVRGQSNSTSGRAVSGLATAATGVTSGMEGISNSSEGRGVYGLTPATTGETTGVWGQSDSSEGRGVFGLASRTTGENFGVSGQSRGNSGRGVFGLATATTGNTIGVEGRSNSSSGRGVLGLASATTGSTTGVEGQSNSSSGRGVIGRATRTTGNTVGVLGESDSNAGRGVEGIAFATTGTTIGVRGISQSNSGQGVVGFASAPAGITYGVEGRSNSTDGRGVFGLATATTGTTFGVMGQSNSTSGRGVIGHATHTTGVNIGVYGQSSSTAGRGVWGQALASSGPTIGVRGTISSPSGNAGWFEGPAGSGNYFQRKVGIGTSFPAAMLDVVPDSTVNAIRATHSNGSRGILGDVNAGVYGERGPGSSPKGWLGYINAGVFGQAGTTVSGALAGRFEGNVLVTGGLSKGGGSFQIDHPLDPENQYLFHSFVESPDMMNIYNGNVVTDRAGYAEVELPDYFEALNTDFRYQLTVIGAFAQAIVAEEVEGNRFVIATDQPGVKVSWQVTGIRDDAWARANRIEVEVPKPEKERGQYLHPAAWGVTVDGEDVQ